MRESHSRREKSEKGGSGKRRMPKKQQRWCKTGGEKATCKAKLFLPDDPSPAQIMQHGRVLNAMLFFAPLPPTCVLSLHAPLKRAPNSPALFAQIDSDSMSPPSPLSLYSIGAEVSQIIKAIALWNVNALSTAYPQRRGFLADSKRITPHPNHQ